MVEKMKIKDLGNRKVKIALCLDKKITLNKNISKNSIAENNDKNPIKNNTTKTNEKSALLKPIPTIIILLSIFLFLPAIAFAIPNSLTLQGKLTNSAGASQQGAFQFVFRIYDVANASTYTINETIFYTNSSGQLAQTEANITYFNYSNALYFRNMSVTTDANGIYDVVLENVSLPFDRQYYLGIQVGSDNESMPRVNLTSSPYSFRANVSEALNPNASYFVANLSISGNLTVGTIFYVDSANARIGINTTNPANTLTVQGTLNVTPAGQESASLFIPSSGFVGIGASNPAYLLQVGNVSKAVNLSGILFVSGDSKSVGIGTASPTSLLHVLGNVNLTRNLTVGDGNTSLEIRTANFNVSNGDLSISGGIKAGGGFNISGDVNITGNLFVVNNAVIGSNGSNTLVVSAQVASNLVPSDNTRNLGSPTNFWRLAYIDKLTVNNLTAAASNISGTGFPSFTINANYSGDDGQDVTLIFERGTPVTNAVLFWDSTNKRFDFNFPLWIEPNMNLTVDTNTLFVDGSVDRVGIGTATPQYLLQVASGTDGRSVNLSNVLYVNGSSGNVGIGTTSPSARLHVSGPSAPIIQVQQSGGGGATGFIQSVDTTEVQVGSISAGDVAVLYASGRRIIVNDSGAVALGGSPDLTFAGAKMVIDSAGNVGIGTTAPAGLLHVTGGNVLFGPQSVVALPRTALQINVNDATNNDNTDVLTLSHFTTGTAANGIGAGIMFEAEEGAGNSNNIAYIRGLLTDVTDGAEKGALAFGTLTGGTSAEAMRITNTGNVGIGTTSPTDRLQIMGNFSVRNESDASKVFLFVSNATGNVGIGTTSPVQKLDVVGGNRAAAQITLLSMSYSDLQMLANDEISIDFKQRSDVLPMGRISGFVQSAANNDAGLKFYTAPLGVLTTTPAVTITSAGNVGIGTTTPTEKLVVYDGNFSIRNSTNVRLFVSNVTGNVGIGTTNPGSKLSINTNVNGDGILLSNPADAAGTYSDIMWQISIANPNAQSAIRFRQPNAGHGGEISFHTDDTAGTLGQRVTIDTSGNVGIGTTAPSEKLEVSGDIRLGGNLTSTNFNINETSNSIVFSATGNKNLVFTTNATLWT